MPPMTTACPRSQLLALVLVVVVTVVLAMPAPAEADALTALAIVGLVLAGVVIIAYHVVANVEGARRADTGGVVWLACAGLDCPVSVAAPTPAAERVEAP